MPIYIEEHYYQESHSGNPDDFLLGFENLFPGSGSISDGAAFNPFATADGECDEFCQKVFALDTQSQVRTNGNAASSHVTTVLLSDWLARRSSSRTS